MLHERGAWAGPCGPAFELQGTQEKKELALSGGQLGGGAQAGRMVRWLRPSQGRGMAGLDWTEDGLLGVSGGGGDLEMAVPGLASFLAFFSRPQTPRVPRWGRGGRQRGASWALTLPLLTTPLPSPSPLPALSVCLILYPPPAGALGLCVQRPHPPPPPPHPLLAVVIGGALIQEHKSRPFESESLWLWGLSIGFCFKAVWGVTLV